MTPRLMQSVWWTVMILSGVFCLICSRAPHHSHVLTGVFAVISIWSILHYLSPTISHD